MTIFEYLNSLLFTKNKIELNCDDETQFSSFMINRWCSFYSPEVANLINETSNKQMISFLNCKQDQYNYFYTVLPKFKFKRIAYIKKSKKEDEKDKLIVPEFYSEKQYSNLLELAQLYTN